MIEIRSLSYHYGSNQAVNDINTDIEPGRIYGLMGENGAGKTTLLKLLCGLRKPSDGSISVDGTNPFDRSAEFLREVFFLQDEVGQTNETALDYARSRAVFRPKFSLDAFKSAMDRFGLDTAKKLKYMSSGECKKAHISFALACNCSYLYMDEPTNALDIPSKDAFRKLMEEYVSADRTIVISTHQVRDLQEILDPIIILHGGNLVLNASIADIRAADDFGNDLEALFVKVMSDVERFKQLFIR